MHTDVVRQGRLDGVRDADIEDFLSSMKADREIAQADLLVDVAHLLMLIRCEIIPADPAGSLMKHLLSLYENGIPKEAFDNRYEDIHAGIESFLIRETGIETGGRLHAGRSRNDEVATCLRIRTREILLDQIDSLIQLREVLVHRAVEHIHTVMPGFTHLQHAQPTTLAHHLLAYEEMFSRDCERLSGAFERTNRSPLGSAAFASTGYPIDREYTARVLGFDGLSYNTMDAVASRDFATESLAADTILITHISRFCEELVIWSSAFVRFVELDDRYCSTSSIMPQKKNPDVAEIMRSRAGTILGAFVSAITIIKGLPLSYNRDLQDLTPHLLRGTTAISRDIRLLSGMIQTATFRQDRMREEASRGFSTATDLADHLVRTYGMPFRMAHNIIGRTIRNGTINLAGIDEASMELTKKTISELGLTDQEISRVLDVTESINARNHPGGPAPSAVLQEIEIRKKQIHDDRTSVKEQKKKIEVAISELLDSAKRFVNE